MYPVHLYVTVPFSFLCQKDEREHAQAEQVHAEDGARAHFLLLVPSKIEKKKAAHVIIVTFTNSSSVSRIPFNKYDFVLAVKRRQLC